MAGKAPVFADRHLYGTMDELSKNQLIDLTIDLCRREIGESASNEQVVAWIQQQMTTVWLHRHDKPKNLVSYYALRQRQIAEYRAKMEAT